MLPPYVCTHIHIRTGTYTHNGKFQCGVFASRHFCTSQKLVHTHCNCAPSKSSNSVYPFSLKNFSYFHTYTHTNTCTGEQCTRQLQRYFFYKLNPYVRRYPLPHKHFPQRLLIWNYHFLQWKRSIVLGNGIQPPLVVFPYVFHRYSELYFLFFFFVFLLAFPGKYALHLPLDASNAVWRERKALSPFTAECAVPLSLRMPASQLFDCTVYRSAESLEKPGRRAQFERRALRPMKNLCSFYTSSRIPNCI